MKLAPITLILIVGGPASASAQFIGNLVLEPTGCESSGTCILGENFGFIDSRDVGWEAEEGNSTDGASIPKWAQRFVGIPFDSDYVPASVLHDHYSKSNRPVRGWLETQKMFFEALIATGVSEHRASLLYAGVLIGSGKWITQMEGRPCKAVENCVQQTVQIKLLRTDEIYGTEQYFELYNRVTSKIKEPHTVGMRAVEDLVRAELPTDIYMNNPSGFIRSGIEFGVLATE